MANKNTELYNLRTTHERAERTDVNQLRKDTNNYLTNNADPTRKELGILAGTWAFVAENIEREAWRDYTPEQWAQLEYQHIEKSRYTMPDLLDDILTAREYGSVTEEGAREWAASYQECSYVFCINVFNGRKDQRFCSEDCRKRMHRAQKRYEETGTYLPTSAYVDRREQTEERDYQEREIATEDGELNDKLIMQAQKRVYGGRRDRKVEIMREKSKKTAEKRRENPVNSRGGDNANAFLCFDTNAVNSKKEVI